MKTAVAHTSLMAFDHLKATGGIEPKQRKILEAMRPGFLYSRRQISVITGLETSCVSARVNALIYYGLIDVCGHIKCPITNKLVEAIKLSADQKELFA